MGDDEAALVRLWREKRGEVEPEDLTANLIVQLGNVTEHLNRRWYERNTGQVVTEVQRQVFHPVKRWMAATLDGVVEGTGAVFEAKFMLPWSFSEEAAAEKHMPQLQHNMWVTASRLKFAQGRALGRKVSDEFTVPLCRAHHRELHQRGDERIWWQQVNLDPLPI
jgi:predicted phage-related endonuclease